MTRNDDALNDAPRPAAVLRQPQAAVAMVRQRRTDLIWILGAIGIAMAFVLFTGNGWTG
jgi:hypothetical protein